MSFDIDDLTSFYLDHEPEFVLLETCQISHPSWDESFNIVTNHDDGIVATLEDDSVVEFKYVPAKIIKGSAADDLDQSIQLVVGDLGEIIPNLIQKIREANSLEKPSVTYRSYAYDASANQFINNKPIEIIKGLYISTSSRDRNSTSIDASTPSKNQVRVGRLYDFENYPDLKGFV